MERDGHHCRRCRSAECLSVHHVNGDHKDNRDENLEVLCGICDLNAHRTLRARRLYEERFVGESVVRT